MCVCVPVSLTLPLHHPLLSHRLFPFTNYARYNLPLCSGIIYKITQRLSIPVPLFPHASYPLPLHPMCSCIYMRLHDAYPSTCQVLNNSNDGSFLISCCSEQTGSGRLRNNMSRDHQSAIYLPGIYRTLKDAVVGACSKSCKGVCFIKFLVEILYCK